MIPKGVERTVHYLAWDTANNVIASGDAANHTLQVVRDGVLAAATNAPAALGILNKIVLTASEMDGNSVALAGVSSTPDIVIVPVIIITDATSEGIQIFIPFTVWDKAANAPKTGDLGNLSIFVAAEGVVAAVTNAPVEISAANAPGLYGILLSVAENAGIFMSVFGTSETTDVNVLPISYATDPGRFSASYQLPQFVLFENEEILIFEGCSP
jgi:hypothetical protein